MARKNWSFEEIQGLIAAVKRNPSLYDRRHPDYNLIRAKEDIWKVISKVPPILEKNPEECKKKWKHLRIQQRRILMSKVRNASKNATIQWNCYDALKFLIPHMDWTPTDDVKREPDLDMSYTSNDYEYDQDDCNNDDTYDTQSDRGDSSSSSNEGSIAATQADSTNATRLLVTPNSSFGIATVAENANRHQQFSIGSTGVPKAKSPEGSAISPTHDIGLSIANQLQTNRLLTAPMSAPSTMNYFFMDVAMQMERLNDIAQMELKIDIHRLILDKLRNQRNLR